MEVKHPNNIKDTSLISVHELKDILGKPNVKVFDVRGIWGKTPNSLYEDYVLGHIPNAIFLDWRKEFIDVSKVPSLAQVSSFVEAKKSFKNLGIKKGDKIVLYDDYHHIFAGRVWWAMRYWGFTNVQVLNGGFKYWKSQGFSITKEILKVEKGTFEPKCQEGLRLSLEDFIIEKEKAYVLDGRGMAGYKGKLEDPRTGHIPGAISTAYTSFLDKETGLFIGESEIIALFNKAIPNWKSEKIICSCGAGYSGTVAMLALASLSIKASLFDGSFNVWKLDSNRPVSQSI